MYVVSQVKVEAVAEDELVELWLVEVRSVDEDDEELLCADVDTNDEDCVVREEVELLLL